MLKKKPLCNSNLYMQRKKSPNKKNIVRRANENIPNNIPIRSRRYIKKDTLGEGSYGVVYKAFDTETGKIVAIKCLKTKESIESFQGELDLLKRLHHSAIVPYLDSFYDKKGGLEIVMEYADNGSILDVIHTYGNLNENVAAIYISQVLQGLNYLHKQNVIHRDIKAANILVQCGIAKLADFGLALDLNEYGHTLRECAGTPYWMAPECINGDPVNHKCDIWSVGSTTIELLSGHPPLFDLAPLPAMFQIAGERPMPIPKNVSDKCKSFLLACFKKNPKKRPEAEELLQHPWILQALQVMKSAQELSTMKHKKSHDYKSLSICLESVNGLYAYIDNQQQRTPEEIIFDLNDENYYEESVYNTMQLLNSKKGIPQLVLNFCGLRNLIDHFETEKHRTITLNFFQELAVNSDRIASSLIEHGIIQDLFDSADPHSIITAMLILMKSSSGSKIFFGCRIYTHLFRLFEIATIRPFISAFLLKILSAELPTILLTSKLFTKPIIKSIIETVFKSVVLEQDYYKLIDEKFKDMKSIRSKNDLLQPRISNDFFEKAKSFMQDSLSLLNFIATLSLETQILISKEMDPLIYLIVQSEKYANITPNYLIKLISVFTIIFKDRFARANVRCDLLINPLIDLLESDDKNISASALNCLTLMLLNNPALTEQAVKNGLCDSLYNLIDKSDTNPHAYHMICYIPTVSKYAAYKMKEAKLFDRLINMTSSVEWREKTVKAISKWSNFDHKYLDQQILEYNRTTDDSFVSLYEICIDMIKNYHIRLIWFSDLKLIVKNCSSFAKSINNDDFYDMIFSALDNSGEFKIDLLELLLEVLLQAEDPTLSAASILPKLKGYSENKDFRIQKIVLRIRVISGQ